ncbi:MAG: metal-sensing transcriptional repressor [Treponema sp.]|nr:metal-sensing transcriptional repressor [Treponema sp.]
MAECCEEHRFEESNGEKKTVRDEDKKKQLLTRLNRIEGQIRGLKKLIESDSYCTDILVQTSAARSALESFSNEVLGCHIRTCVKRDLLAGKDDVIDELLWTLKKLK